MSDAAIIPLDPATCDIDLLMSYVNEINPKTLPLSELDLTAIITYHRRNRAYRAAGGKAKPPAANQLSLTDLLARNGNTRALAPTSTPGLPAGPIRRI